MLTYQTLHPDYQILYRNTPDTVFANISDAWYPSLPECSAVSFRRLLVPWSSPSVSPQSVCWHFWLKIKAQRKHLPNDTASRIFSTPASKTSNLAYPTLCLLICPALCMFQPQKWWSWTRRATRCQSGTIKPGVQWNLRASRLKSRRLAITSAGVTVTSPSRRE